MRATRVKKRYLRTRLTAGFLATLSQRPRVRVLGVGTKQWFLSRPEHQCMMLKMLTTSLWRRRYWRDEIFSLFSAPSYSKERRGCLYQERDFVLKLFRVDRALQVMDSCICLPLVGVRVVGRSAWEREISSRSSGLARSRRLGPINRHRHGGPWTLRS